MDKLDEFIKMIHESDFGEDLALRVKEIPPHQLLDIGAECHNAKVDVMNGDGKYNIDDLLAVECALYPIFSLFVFMTVGFDFDEESHKIVWR